MKARDSRSASGKIRLPTLPKLGIIHCGSQQVASAQTTGNLHAEPSCRTAPQNETGLTARIGLIADTHVPDRASQLHPAVIPALQQARVDVILHAGDVSVPRILEQLVAVAPVHAVQGNRDWVRLRKLPMTRTLSWGGLQIGLVHGHGGFWRYWREKLRRLRYGYHLEFYIPYLIRTFPKADVIVFGHSHVPETRRIDGKLLVNPGTTCCPDGDFGPSIGVLEIDRGEAHAKVIWLENEPPDQEGYDRN